MRTLNSVLAGVLASSVLVATVSVPQVSHAAPSETDRMKEAETLYKAGKNKFETADYEEALALWKEAYSLLPDSEKAHVIRHTLVWNISEAQIKAYEINRNVTHLRKAKLLLEDYLTQHRQLYGDEGEAAKERGEARERLKEVEKMIDEAEARGEKATPIATPSGGGETPAGEGEPTGEGEPAGEPEQEEPPEELSPEEQAKRDRIELIKTDPVVRAQYGKATGLMVGGGVMAGIGIILAGVGAIAAINIGLCDDPDPTIAAADPDRCRRVSGGIALGTGIPGLGMLAGGGAMFGIGLKRRIDLKNPNKPLPAGPGGAAPAPEGPAQPDAQPDAQPEAAPVAEPEEPAAYLSPIFLREGAGAGLTIRF